MVQNRTILRQSWFFIMKNCVRQNSSASLEPFFVWHGSQNYLEPFDGLLMKE